MQLKFQEDRPTERDMYAFWAEAENPVQSKDAITEARMKVGLIKIDSNQKSAAIGASRVKKGTRSSMLTAVVLVNDPKTIGKRALVVPYEPCSSDEAAQRFPR